MNNSRLIILGILLTHVKIYLKNEIKPYIENNTKLIFKNLAAEKIHQPCILKKFLLTPKFTVNNQPE